MNNMINFRCIILILMAIVSVTTAHAQLNPPDQDYVLRFAERSLAVAPDDPVFDLGAEFTIAGWFYLEKYENKKFIFGRVNSDPNKFEHPYVLRFGPEFESLEFVISNSEDRSIIWEDAPFDQWVHIAVTLKNDTTRFYGNGIEMGNLEFAEIPTSEATSFSVGMPVDQEDNPLRGTGFSGMARQLSIWNKSLSQSDINHIAENTLEGVEQGLLTYWKMEEFPQEEILDSGSHKLHLSMGANLIQRNRDRRFDPLWYREEAVENPYFKVHEIDLFELLSIPDSNYAVNPIIIDFNHDGLKDIIVIQTDVFNNAPPYEFHPVFFLQNTGNFNFIDVTDQFSTDARGIFEFKIHDFDGDGFDDVVTSDIGHDFDPFPGAANELFLSSEKYSNTSTERYPSAENGFTHGLATGDVDNDGDTDIFEPNWGANVNPLLLINDGEGFFKNKIETYLPETYITGEQASNTVHLADFNRDGYDDFIMGVSPSTGDFSYDRDRLLLNTQNNHFEERTSAFPDRNVNGQTALPLQMSSGDFDGDGYLDLLTSHIIGESSGFIRLYKNNRDSSFSHNPDAISAQTIDTGLSPTVFVVTTTADFNQDGWLDAYVEGAHGGSYLFLNDGTGKLEETNQILSPKIRDGGRATVMGDLNGDGRTDILQFLPFFSERSILILENVRNYDTGSTPQTLPPAPVLANPGSNESTNQRVRFTWEEEKPHPFSDFQLAEDKEFTNIVKERDRYTGLSISIDSLELDKTFYWRVRGENYVGEGSWSEVRSFTVGTAVSNEEEVLTEIPREFSLKQNYPNPFNPTTTIQYGLPKAAKVHLTIYDLMGRQVAVLVDQRQSAGTHSVNFDASRLSSGMYLYRIEAGNFTQSKKLMLIK